MTQEEKDKLLEEAKRRYPIGTIAICLTDKVEETIDSDLEWYWGDNIVQMANPRTRVYKDGQWAEIISKPEKDTIKVDYDKVDWNNVKGLRVKWLKNVYDNKDKIETIIDNKFSADCILLESFGTCSIGRFKLNEIAFIDNPPIIKEEKSIEKPQFEVGKWYSFNWDWNGPNSTIIAKIQKVDKNSINVSWRSYLWREKDYSSSDTYDFADISNVKELSIEEIQQYLPDGHPDKIVENKEEIPKYVECISGNNGSHYTGRIYKVENGKISCEVTGTPTKWSGFNSGGFKFKISTKEAYDKQQRELEMWDNKEPEIKEFTKGEYYYVTYVDRPELKYIVIGDEGLKTLDGINLYYNSYDTRYSFSNIKIQIRKATFSEKQWLDRCIKENRFIPKEEALKTEEEWVPKIVDWVHLLSGNTTIALAKPEIDSWGIKLTEENQELLKLTSMYQSLEKEEIQHSKTNKIKAKLIPVKKLIKN